MSPEPRCVASLDGARCDLPPDHDGMHSADDGFSEFWWEEAPDGLLLRKIRSNYLPRPQEITP